MDPIENFSGVAPLFPLPGATLFPHVVQPFHMFEPRYRELAEDVLNGDQLIAVGILKPGNSDLYSTKQAPIFDTVCLGHVSSGERLVDGRYNLIVNGLARAAVVGEPETDRLYRSVQLELLNEQVPIADDDQKELRQSLIRSFENQHPEIAAHPAVKKTLESVLPIGVLCDFIAHVGDVETPLAAKILSETDVRARAQIVQQWLTQQGAGLPFPPKFSEN